VCIERARRLLAFGEAAETRRIHAKIAARAIAPSLEKIKKAAAVRLAAAFVVARATGGSNRPSAVFDDLGIKRGNEGLFGRGQIKQRKSVKLNAKKRLSWISGGNPG